jgi:hypothetical protein
MKRNFFLLLLLILQAPLWTGCTALLWEKSTLSTYYHPAGPPNLQLYYSEAQKDFLVQYDESRNKETKIHTRYYWLKPNVKLTEGGRRPVFLDVVTVDGLKQLPQTPIVLNPPPPGLNGLYVVCRPDDIRFQLYSGTNQIHSYILPDYDANQKTALKVLLTPPAVIVDATVIGAVIYLLFYVNTDG